ncbi:MAG: hypothetical protein IKN21_06955 [Prevotella sp.]|nr:hypothetical protein [Prevotella sp.]
MARSLWIYQQAHDGYVEAFANYQNRLLEYRQASPMASQPSSVSTR